MKEEIFDTVIDLKIRRLTRSVLCGKKFKDKVADLVDRRFLIARISSSLHSLRRDRGRGKEKHQGTTTKYTALDPYTDDDPTKNQISSNMADNHDGIYDATVQDRRKNLSVAEVPLFKNWEPSRKSQNIQHGRSVAQN